MTIILMILVAMVGINILTASLHIQLYNNMRDQKENLYFAFFCISVAVYDFLRILYYQSQNNEETLIYSRLIYSSIGILAIALINFIKTMINKKSDVVIKFLNIFFGIFIVIAQIPNDHLLNSKEFITRKANILNIEIVYHESKTGTIIHIFTLIIIIGIIYTYYLLLFDYRKRKRKEILMFIIGISVFFTSGIIDSLAPILLLNTIYTTEFAYFFIVIIMSYILIKKFINIYDNERIMNLRFSSLMENSKQGIFKFGENLIADNECSNECEKIFDFDIKNKNIKYIIPELSEILNINILNDIFNNMGKNNSKVLLSILPQVIEKNNKIINLEYKEMYEYNTLKIMIIATDITGKKRLSKKVEANQNMLKMIIKCVVENNQFLDTINDYLKFCEFELYRIIDSEDTNVNKIADIFRSIHTFKGNFSQLNMSNLEKKLHEFENKLVDTKSKIELLNKEKLREFFESYNLKVWIDKDLYKLKSVLGEDFFKQNKNFNLSEDQLNRIIDKVMETIPMKKNYQILLNLNKVKKNLFFIPMIESKIKEDDIMKNIINKTSNEIEGYINKIFGVDVIAKTEIKTNMIFELKNYIVYININVRNLFLGRIYLCFSKNMDIIVRNVAIDGKFDKTNLDEEFKEFTNVMVGSALKELIDGSNHINISTPSLIKSKSEIRIISKKKRQFTILLKFSKGEILIMGIIGEVFDL